MAPSGAAEDDVAARNASASDGPGHGLTSGDHHIIVNYSIWVDSAPQTTTALYATIT